MAYKNFHCADCDHTFAALAGEAALTAVCPGCGRIAKLIRFGMSLGLTFTEAVVGLVVGYAVYTLLSNFGDA
ncbi:MAG: zinc ribbon domain-containing protein [Pyrinomonadaceae bacterium]